MDTKFVNFHTVRPNSYFQKSLNKTSLKYLCSPSEIHPHDPSDLTVFVLVKVKGREGGKTVQS